ncbi:MAG: hypothetical protein ACJA2J_001317 [Candidatus Azotimanducaceae bacterium]
MAKVREVWPAALDGLLCQWIIAVVDQTNALDLRFNPRNTRRKNL